MTTTDVEMSTDKKNVDIEMLRKKLMEWGSGPYLYQLFNKEESINWRNPRLDDYMARASLDSYYYACKRFESFNFSIEPTIVGKVKHCSYSELDQITNFKNPRVIRQTISGRLFHGIIVEGSEERPVIVKTWDFHLPKRDNSLLCVNRFCDEIELFTDERVHMHPNLVKLYRYCCDTRLAVVFDEEFAGVVLSDVLLSDDFGWDERMKVATQLADLFSCLHENNIAIGCVTPAYIMIDKEFNIKVFDFGYATNAFNVDRSILDHAIAPEILKGERTMKSDVYFFGILLLELMAKRKFTFAHGFCNVETLIATAANRGKKYLVHECFTEVDYPTALAITLLVFLCTDLDPDKRPLMKDVIDTLNALGMRGEKRKRDENEAEQIKCIRSMLSYCCDTRLAVVFDEEFAGVVLSDVLLSDDFGWDERMKVATQLADLFSCLHENNIALGCVTPAYIMIDKEFNIKVFDFGYATNAFNVDRSILDHAIAPEILKGERTMKSDVYFFGILLLELMAKRKFTFVHGFCYLETLIANAANRGKKYLVHECFTEVDYPTALAITLVVFLCTDFDPDKRPSMKDVIDTLNAMGMRGRKRKRDENEAE